MAQHNLLSLLDKGLKVTLNSDDPAYFGGYMNANFLAVQEAHKLNRQQWQKLTENAIGASFLAEEDKQALLSELHSYVARN